MDVKVLEFTCIAVILAQSVYSRNKDNLLLKRGAEGEFGIVFP